MRGARRPTRRPPQQRADPYRRWKEAARPVRGRQKPQAGQGFPRPRPEGPQAHHRAARAAHQGNRHPHGNPEEICLQCGIYLQKRCLVKEVVRADCMLSREFQKPRQKIMLRTIKLQREAEPEWARQVSERPGCEGLFSCLQCGSCSGACPLSIYMDYTPRRIIALVREGFRKDALSSMTIWLCASCYSCAVHCPRQIHVTDRHVRPQARGHADHLYPARLPVPVLAREFYKMVRRRGRSSEFWLVLRMALQSNPFDAARHDAHRLGPVPHRPALPASVSASRASPSCARWSAAGGGADEPLRVFPGMLPAGHRRGLRREPADPLPPARSAPRGTARLELLRRHFVYVDRRGIRVSAFGAQPGAGAQGRMPRPAGPVQRLLPGAAQDAGLRRALSRPSASASKQSLAAADLPVLDGVRVRHPLEVLYTDVGVERIRAAGGAQVDAAARWPAITAASSCAPMARPTATTTPCAWTSCCGAIGVPTVEYSLKTNCCGGALTGTMHPDRRAH